MDRAATGIMGALLAIVTALLILAAKTLGVVLRFAYRHRHVIPYIISDARLRRRHPRRCERPAMPHVFDRCQVTLTHLRPAD